MKERRLVGLMWLLGCFNLAVLLLCIAFAPRQDSFMWRTDDSFDYLVKSRKWDMLPWVISASLLVSAGIYAFAYFWFTARKDCPDGY